MARLRVKDGALAGRVVEVEGEVGIGRENADLTLPDDQVSRRHATVRKTAQGLEIEDLGSTNGTWVGGRRVTAPTQLAAGDEIRVGGTALGVELATPMPVAQPAARPAPAPYAAPVAPAAPQPVVHAYAAPPAYAPAGFGATQGRGAATRGAIAIVVTFVVIGLDAILLLLYFALR